METTKKLAWEVAQMAGNELIELPKATTPNYKLSAAGSLGFGFLSMLMWLDQGYLSKYLALTSAVASAGFAINQFGGIQKTCRTFYNGAQTFFDYIKSNPTYSSNAIEMAATPRKSM